MSSCWQLLSYNKRERGDRRQADPRATAGANNPYTYNQRKSQTVTRLSTGSPIFIRMSYLVWWRLTIKANWNSMWHMYLKINEYIYISAAIAEYVIKHQHTTCFLLLLRLQFQKLSRFQERFDAHFCAGKKDCGSSGGEKALKSAGATGTTSLSTKVGEVPGWSW